MSDPIIEEIRGYRDQHAAEFNYDLKAIVEDYQRQERERGIELVTLSPRPCEPSVARPMVDFQERSGVIKAVSPT